MVGDLTKKNCTTVFHNIQKDYSDTYYFRLDCPTVQFTFVTGVSIEVQTGDLQSEPFIFKCANVSSSSHFTLPADGDTRLKHKPTFIKILLILVSFENWGY